MLDSPATPNRQRLLLVLLVAFLARGGLLLVAQGQSSGDYLGFELLRTPDSRSYIKLAYSMQSEGKFENSDGPEVFRTPGYPAFLAPVQWAVERLYEHDWGGADCAAVFAQIVVDAILVALTALLASRLAGPRAGFVAGFFQAISPLAIGASCRILSDSLYAFVFTVAALLLVAHLQTGRWRTLVASAIVLGAACYIRPVGQFMAPLFAIAAALACRGRLARAYPGRPSRGDVAPSPSCEGKPESPLTGMLSTRCDAPPKREPRADPLPWPRRLLWRLAPAGLFLAIFAGCLAPWIVRNVVRADYWGFSSVFGDTLYFFAVPQVKESDIGLSVSASFPPADVQQRAAQAFLRDANHTVGAAARWRQARALDFLSAHPWAYAKLHAKGCLAFWLPSTDVLEVAGLTAGGKGTLDVLHREGLWSAVRHYFGGDWRAIPLAVPIALFTLGQYLAAALGLWLGGRRTRWGVPPQVTFLVLLVVFSCLVSGTTGVPRFRVPVEPILNLAAAAGVLRLGRRAPQEIAGLSKS